MTIGIIGAGLSGLVAAKTCLEYGYRIQIFEKDMELGGVWSGSRRYPGVTTQNTKDTYHFSDFPMPDDYPEWPTGKQVQDYLISYAERFDLLRHVRFGHTVTSTDFKDNAWTIVGKVGKSIFGCQVDYLIVCNGTFSDPFVPEMPGMDTFVRAGGQILHSTEFHDSTIAARKDLVVVGYGKSACDIITAASGQAKTAHLIFREPKWKIPRFIKGLNMKYLLLNRLAEAFIKPADQHNRIDKFVNKIGLAKIMLSFLENYIAKKHMLRELDLFPSSTLKEQAFGEISLETPDFFEKVKRGEIIAERGEIESIHGKKLVLTTGQIIDCDVLIFASGFKQSIPFISEALQKKFTDEQGNYLLYHHILPAGVPGLAFIGYNSSIQCPISSEFASLWLCEYLSGRITRPSESEIRKEGVEFIKWRSQHRPNCIHRGLNTMPGTIHHVDMLLSEMNAPLPLLSLIPDWLLLSKPVRYQKSREKILSRNKMVISR